MHEQAIAPDGRQPGERETAFPNHAEEIQALRDGTHPALNDTEPDDREHSVSVDHSKQQADDDDA